MKLDCYAVLGLSPTAEDVVIRAAYLALMRAYHPDRNGSAEAAARARAITEAYKTIGDPVRRAEYDAGRWENQFEIRGYEEAEALPRVSRKPLSIRLPRLHSIEWPKLPEFRWPDPAVSAVAASALAITLAVMVVPMPQSAQPVPAPAPSAGKAEATQRPANRVASIAPRPAEPIRPAPTEVAVPKETPPEPVQAIADNPIPAKADVQARPKVIAEVLPPPATRPPPPVDQKARVAALESMSTSFFNQSVMHADDGRRTQLQRARDLFVIARNACKSDSCVGDAHAGYIRDISRIMKNP